MSTTEQILPEGNVAGRVEVRGIDHVPAAERRGRPFEMFPLWFSANLSYLYIIFGGLLILIGLNLVQALLVVLVGNLFYVLVGLIATSGVRYGTSTVNVSRLMFGSAGNRAFGAFLTWIVVVAFEAINLSIGAFAGFALLSTVGVHVSTAVEVVVLLVIAVATFALSILGHATILRVASAVSWLTGLAAVVLFVFVVGHADFAYSPPQSLHGALAVATVLIGLTLIASGPLSWVTVPAEFARYLPESSPRWKVVLWTSAGAYLSSAFLAVTGVLAGTVVDMTDPQTAMKAIMPGWFYPLFLLLIVVGTSINNALGIYSSGLALQAMGVRTRRSLSVLLDCVVGGAMTVYAVFVSNFLTTLNGFLALSVVWLGPYAGVFVAHLFLSRRHRAQDGVERQLAEVPRINLAGVGALLTGALVAFLCANTTYWHGPISTALNGADLSPYVGTLLAAGVYLAASRLLAGRAAARPAIARTPLAVSETL